MKLCALLLLTLTLSVVSWCQPVDGGSCSYCFCVGDVTCNGSDCANPGGCTSQSFTPPCSGTYQFRSKVICPGGSSCTHCSACIDVFTAADPLHSIGGCHNSHCDLGQCEEPCTINLIGGTAYVLRVCLLPCPGNLSTCRECGADCKGYGCVYRNIITPCVPL